MDLLNPGPQQQNQRQLLTEQQIGQMHDLAEALQKNALDSSPIYSPWAGAARMADALVGNLTQGRQAQAQNEQSQFRAQEYRGAFGGQGGDPTVPQGSSDAGTTGGVAQNEKDAIAANESGGNYGEIGPHVPATHTHPAGYAIGKYQVMNYDLPNRLAAAGLPPMNEAEFLRNPDAQEKQFDHEFGNLRQSHSFADAASMWHSGVPLDQAIKEHRTDARPGTPGMTTQSYVQRALQHLNPISQAHAAEGQASPSEMVAATFGTNPAGEPQSLGNPNGPQTPIPMPRPAGMSPGSPMPAQTPTSPQPAAAPAPAPAPPPAPQAAPQPQQPPATGQPIPGTMSPAEREHIFNLISHPATQAEGLALLNEFIKPKPEKFITGFTGTGTPFSGYRPSQVPETPVEQPGGQHLWGVGVPLLSPGSRGGTPYGTNVSPRGQAPQETGHGRVNGKGYPVHEDGSIDQERLHGWIMQGWRPPQ